MWNGVQNKFSGKTEWNFFQTLSFQKRYVYEGILQHFNFLDVGECARGPAPTLATKSWVFKRLLWRLKQRAEFSRGPAPTHFLHERGWLMRKTISSQWRENICRAPTPFAPQRKITLNVVRHTFVTREGLRYTVVLPSLRNSERKCMKRRRPMWTVIIQHFPY